MLACLFVSTSVDFDSRTVYDGITGGRGNCSVPAESPRHPCGDLNRVREDVPSPASLALHGRVDGQR